MEDLIEQLSDGLSKLQFDSVKETVDNFRQKNPPNTATNFHGWHCLVTCIGQLSVAEKSYHSLAFLAPKGGGFFVVRNKEQTNYYNQIRTELAKGNECLRRNLPEKIEKNCCDFQQTTSTGSLNSLGIPTTSHDGANSNMVNTVVSGPDSLVEHLFGQFQAYVSARIDMMNFFETLSNVGQPRGISLNQAIHLLHEVQEKHTGTFHHPRLNCLETRFNCEMEILSNLLNCQQSLRNLIFLQSLVYLKEAKYRLAQWLSGCDLEKKERRAGWWFGFGSTDKSGATLRLCNWMSHLYDLLMGKFSLYFHEVLSRHASVPEMKHSVGLLPAGANFLQRFSMFQRKHDALHLCLILNRQNEKTAFRGLGYQHPERVFNECSSSRGLADTYPIVFRLPSEKTPDKLHPSLAGLLKEASDESSSQSLNAQQQTFSNALIKHLYDRGQDLTFYVTNLESNIYMALVFPTRKSEKDANICTFLSESVAELRCSKAFASLRNPLK